MTMTLICSLYISLYLLLAQVCAVSYHISLYVCRDRYVAFHCLSTGCGADTILQPDVTPSLSLYPRLENSKPPSHLSEIRPCLVSIFASRGRKSYVRPPVFRQQNFAFWPTYITRISRYGILMHYAPRKSRTDEHPFAAKILTELVFGRLNLSCFIEKGWVVV